MVSELSCSIAGTVQRVQIAAGTLAQRVYQADEVQEAFRCHYGLNPEYRDRIVTGAMRVSGIGPDGEVRIVELSGHPFFVATLFVPQLRSSPSMPHPLILAYLEAAARVSERAHHVTRQTVRCRLD